MSSVTDIKPYDTSIARDPGVKALILLAHSLGWNVIVRRNNPIIIRALDGTNIDLLGESRYRASAFQSRLSRIMSHSVERTPTIELMDKIIKAVKPNQDQERRLRLALGESPQQHRDRIANDQPAQEKRVKDEHLTQRIEVPTEWVDEAPEPEPEPEQPDAPIEDEKHLVRTRPAIVAESKPRGGVWYGYISPIAIERTWSDGSTDFKCKLCSYSHQYVSGLSGHMGRKHKGHRSDPAEREWVELPPDQRPPSPYRRRTKEATVEPTTPTPEPEPDPEPEVIELPPLPDPDEMSADTILDAIRQLVGVGDEMEHLRAENERLVAENEQLKSNLQALKDLLAGI